jgi:hypothetical protein
MDRGLLEPASIVENDSIVDDGGDKMVDLRGRLANSAQVLVTSGEYSHRGISIGHKRRIFP